MAEFYTEPEWLEIVREQERVLRPERFTRKDALAVGLEIVRLADQRYHGAAAAAILEDETVIFSYKMEGTGLENDWWMRRKLAVSRRTGMSSLRACLEEKAGAAILPEDEARRADLAVCGGCFPLRMRDGELRGYLLVSGLHHQEGHQVIADALAARLGTRVGNIAG